MPLATQAKLLRVLEDRTVIPVGANEERPVDVRIVAATNRDLEERVREGRFREDLYYRLAVLAVELPPLRERLEDIPLLADHFRRECAERHNKTVDRVSDEVVGVLREHDWPGNVREFRNVVETMVVLDQDGVLGLEDLPRTLRPADLPAAAAAGVGGGGEAPGAPTAGGYELAGKSLRQVEEDLIAATLASVDGNRQKAAELLGMGERTLYRKIKDYGL
jgi:two-component system response regulator HydG